MAAVRHDHAVAAAEERVKARANALRVDWQNLKASTRSTLTGGAMIGSVAMVGAFLGKRSRAPSSAVECKCVKSSPSLLRVLLLAAITPLLEGAVARGLGYLADRVDGHSTDSSPHERATDAGVSR
jgi:hypothetical protein